jgi:large subunit ribosomal protein L17
MSQTTAGRKLGLKSGHRRSVLRNLATDLLRYESIRTTSPRAREVTRMAERLISVAKAGDGIARRRVQRDIRDPQVLEKLFGALKVRYQTRAGGYVRIFSIENRSGDNAPMSLLKLIP